MAVKVHHVTRMDRVLAVYEPEFAFTVAFHYVCPQVTLSLALLIFLLGRIALRMENPHYDRSTHFWTKVFAIDFALAVVTGMPMEFQFGNNWTGIAKAAGSVIGQTLAMEECSTFLWRVRLLSLFVLGEKPLRPGRRFSRYRRLLAAPTPYTAISGVNSQCTQADAPRT
jgi:cytochrome d ubiquinol oxidase subunit I